MKKSEKTAKKWIFFIFETLITFFTGIFYGAIFDIFRAFYRPFEWFNRNRFKLNIEFLANFLVNFRRKKGQLFFFKRPYLKILLRYDQKPSQPGDSTRVDLS